MGYKGVLFIYYKPNGQNEAKHLMTIVVLKKKLTNKIKTLLLRATLVKRTCLQRYVNIFMSKRRPTTRT